MHKKLKIVGGPRDGQMATIYNGQPSIMLVDPRPTTETTDNVIEIQKTLYTRRMLCVGFELVEYLAPDEMLDIETFVHLIERHK